MRQFGNKLSNAKNGNEVTALMLATKVIPSSNALLLIDALMKSGASLNKRDIHRKHVLLYACEAGVDPAIFYDIVRRSSSNGSLGKWWVHCDREKNGALILAAKSKNVELFRHVMTVARTKDTDFLDNESNNILKILDLIVKWGNTDEHLVIEFLKIIREFAEDNFDHEVRIEPAEGEDYWEEEGLYVGRNPPKIYLEDVIARSLDFRMFDFVREFANLFASDPYIKCIVWKWIEHNKTKTVPTQVQKLALLYEHEELWKKNRIIHLIFLRVLRGRVHSSKDIVNHVSSFLLCPSLDIKTVDEEEYYLRNAIFFCDSEGWLGALCATKDTYLLEVLVLERDKENSF